MKLNSRYVISIKQNTIKFMILNGSKYIHINKHLKLYIIILYLKVEEMISLIMESFVHLLLEEDWLTEETKQFAKQKVIRPT